jgi:hypothetical protein
MDYENMTDSMLFEALRENFPRATLKRITANNRPIVVQLLKAFEEKKRRNGEDKDKAKAASIHL